MAKRILTPTPDDQFRGLLAQHKAQLRLTWPQVAHDAGMRPGTLMHRRRHPSACTVKELRGLRRALDIPAGAIEEALRL